jgi:hypothetical protein
MDSLDFKYIFSKFPAVSGDYVRTYMLKVVNFFKSYKVHLLNISTVYKAFDKRENSIKIYEDWITSGQLEPSDYSQIISEITGDIDITKQDKIILLEKIKFDIERWEFMHLDDKYIFDELREQIASSLNIVNAIDAVIVTDHYKGFPFAGIEYTYQRDDILNIISSMTPYNDINLTNKCNILDRMKIYYED